MGIRNLEYLFRPRSVAVIGASTRQGSVGSVVMANLVRAGYEGQIYPVNPHAPEVHGVKAYSRLGVVPSQIDLAVICTPPPTVPGLMDELGAVGAKAVVIVTAGLSRIRDESGRSLQDQAMERAAAHGIRVLGPNCVGIISTLVRLNATFMQMEALPGRIAFVAQSGALCGAVLDWARASQVGFSHVVSLGDIADVDFGDALDYLASDPHTSSILLYMESIGGSRAREFFSAARGAARNKPVIVVKAGRVAEGAGAAASHTGAMAGADDVYDAAFRRAGMLRVYEIDELFAAAETLSRTLPVRGNRLAIVTNGGGPGVLATDALIERGGKLAELTPQTIDALNKVLPPTWSGANPVDLIGDGDAERYATAIAIIQEDPNVDAMLVMNVPTALASGAQSARAVIEATRRSTRPILTSWLGEDTAGSSRRLLRDAGLAAFATPEEAVRAFMHMAQYRRNQQVLMQTPPSAPAEFTPRPQVVHELLQRRLAEGVAILDEVDAKAVLAAYEIPVVPTVVAANADEAVRRAGEMGFPVVVKVFSPQITHKSDVGGVVLDLNTPEAVHEAVVAMTARVARLCPDARHAGFTIQRMVRRPRAHELILGMTDDRTFGPVILFGAGGTAVEVVGDRAVALPPLNMPLAQELIERTRVYKLLRGYRDRPPADLNAINLTLIKVAQLIGDHPEIAELDINPLIADESGVLALDARLRIVPARTRGAERLAIRPYPGELEERLTLLDGQQVLARPIRPEDRLAHEEFIAQLAPEDLYSRFHGTLRAIDPTQMGRLTQIDYDREMAFVAIRPTTNGTSETLGVVRVATDPDNLRAEFAVVVRSDAKARGLGHALMQKMIRYCRDRGTREIVGDIQSENAAMRQLADELGFQAQERHDDNIVHVRLRLG